MQRWRYSGSDNPASSSRCDYLESYAEVLSPVSAIAVPKPAFALFHESDFVSKLSVRGAY